MFTQLILVEQKISLLTNELAQMFGIISRAKINKYKEKLYSSIVDSYNSPARHYHNLEHALKVVNFVENSFYSDSDNLLLKLAAWFHDIKYDSKSKFNEKDSAEIFRCLSMDILPNQFIQKVMKLIISTSNHLAAKTITEKILADADLFIFAENRETYKSYALAIRQEYIHLRDDEFFSGRIKFLLELLSHINSKGKLFFNLNLNQELQAEKNIEWEILYSQQALNKL